jgi:hypothetical protein
MLVTMIVRDQNDREVERYTAPDGSWIQTDSIGAQHIPAVTDLEAYTFRGYSVYLIPENPPKIPEAIVKILDGRDPNWGKNGWEWMGCNRASAGGTTLSRARELFAWAGSYKGAKADFPVPLTFEACMAVMQNEKYCKELKP